MSNEIECGVSKDTELLTPNGWVNIQRITTKIPVLQYSEDGYMSFARPLGIRKTYVEKAVVLTNIQRHYKQIVHPSHAIPVISGGTKFLKVYPANTVPTSSGLAYVNVGNIYRENNPKLLPIDKIKIIFLCVGKYVYRGKKHDTIRFTVKGLDKLDKLTTLLRECGFEYSVDKCFTGAKQVNDRITVLARVGVNQTPDNYDWVNNNPLTPDWCVEFINELFTWGHTVHKGHENCRTCSFSIVEHACIIQTIATLAGYRTSIKQRYQHQWKKLFTILYINTTSKTLSSRFMIRNTIDYDAIMYNVVTPLNMVVIKLDHAVSVTGCYGIDKPKGLIINREFRQ